MKPEDVNRLLGGYAAGTLTPEEREALCRAALTDQALFDAMADEEALRELLAEPAARAQLLRDLRESPEPRSRRLPAWLRWKPATLALAGSAAALVLVVGVVRYARQEPAAPKLVAQLPQPMAQAPPPAPRIAQEAPARMASGKPRRAPAALPAAPPAPEKGQAEAETAAPAMLESEKKLVAPSLQKVEAALASSPQPASRLCVVLKKSADGVWREPPPGEAFRAGEEVRLRVHPVENGLVKVSVRDGATTTILTPPAGIVVKAGEPLMVPPTGALELAGTSGEKNVRVSFQPALLAPAAGGIDMVRSRAVESREAVDRRDAAAGSGRVVELRLVYRPR